MSASLDIDVRIDTIVVDGIPVGNPADFQVGIQRELARLVTERGAPVRPWPALEIVRIVHEADSSEAPAVAVAAAIYGALSR